ncbi:MAG: ATP-binding protein [Thermoanaerobaculaceae bacterium]|nr:ATP-binding protein [Thermoanaerobaculaceae bacterium]
MIIPLRNINHDEQGFESLCDLYDKTKTFFLETVEFDMSKTTWFDADMCAPFGAILYKLGEMLNTIKFLHINQKVNEILLKNGFLSHYGQSKIPDSYSTTIPYFRFDAKDDRYFAVYIEQKLMNRDEIPNMSLGLKKRFRESIFEIFSNAVIHSQTKLGIFTCGQFFPKKNEISFTVADVGIGICQNVREHIKRDIAPEEAIEWATQERNTTKKGSIPGGLGLKLLKEFVDLNGGSIQIVSQNGYWKREKRVTVKKRFANGFPGTVVSVKINTLDTNKYCLAEELTEADIF